MGKKKRIIIRTRVNVTKGIVPRKASWMPSKNGEHCDKLHAKQRVALSSPDYEHRIHVYIRYVSYIVVVAARVTVSDLRKLFIVRET